MNSETWFCTCFFAALSLGAALTAIFAVDEQDEKVICWICSALAFLAAVGIWWANIP